jgi:hypothetical protein
MMTERQRNKLRSERYKARHHDEQEAVKYSKPEKKMKIKNIMTME